MKFAYLIIAHNEFEVLSRLVATLDDERNDIYVHIDRKVKALPPLHAEKAGLYVLEKRIDTRWGDVSQIRTEYVLFEAAYANGGYSRYILLSGVHLPLKSQDYIHQWFDERAEYEIMTPVPNSDFQTDLKMRRYNLFTRWYARSILTQKLWHLGIILQRHMKIHRNRNYNYSISANWVCLTPHAVGCLLANKRAVMNEWRYSFCGDEFFARTILVRNGFSDYIMMDDGLLLCDFAGKSNPRVYTMKDYDVLKASNCLFARKFSASEMSLIDELTR